ncbi:hypothetical protein [endosymbiont GvMRE of Glomus versiforme]|uniref:hypothetical protein n=1 Tax=endosymbiont GvMRE of Glomus versiforme TaxID=2039283 RepID=UPI001558D47A|nr:hypothetical protein [endosymbiont GvMRE of Glomus versiforme]
MIRRWKDKFLEISALVAGLDLENKKFNNVKIGKTPVNTLRHCDSFNFLSEVEKEK